MAEARLVRRWARVHPSHEEITVSESPSEVLAAKLRGLDLTDGELLLLDHILRRAEAGDVKEVEVEGFAAGPPGAINVFDAPRLLRAGGLTGSAAAPNCHTEPTVWCHPCC
jgi:hypothetical protein